MHRLPPLPNNSFVPISRPPLPSATSFFVISQEGPTVNEEMNANIRRTLQDTMTPYSCIASRLLLDEVSVHSSWLDTNAQEILEEIEKSEIIHPSISKQLSCPRKVSVICLNALKNGVSIIPIANVLIKYMPLEAIAKAKLRTSTICICMRIMAPQALLQVTLSNGSYKKWALDLQKWINDQSCIYIPVLDLSNIAIEVFPPLLIDKLSRTKQVILQRNKFISPLIFDSLSRLPSLKKIDLRNSDFQEPIDSLQNRFYKDKSIIIIS